MPKVSKILADMRANQVGVSFADALKVAEAHFGEPRQKSTSHCFFKTPWKGDPRVNLQKTENNKAKAYQVRQLLQAVDRLEQLQATRGTSDV